MTGSKEAVAGACAGVCGTLLGFPLDTIKTRMQANHRLAESGIVRTFRDITRTEGTVGLYRGVLPPLTSLTILNTINFASYAKFKEVYGVDTTKLAHGQYFEPKIILAGACVGPVASSVSTPFDFLKIQLQIDQASQRRYKGTLSALGSIVKEHGVTALYRGHAVNTTREAIFQAVYFGVYEHVKPIVMLALPAKVAVPLAGGLSGAAGWLTSYPLDCIRTHIQGERPGRHEESTLQVGRKILRERGMRGLYSGVTPSLLRAFLVSGSRFSAYEFAMWMMADR